MGTKIRAALYRGLQLVLLMLLVYGFAQTLPFDLAILFAGDVLFYVEVATAVWLAAQVTRLRHALDYARAVTRPMRRAIRGRAKRMARSLRKRLPDRSSDDDRPWGALVPALVQL